MSVYRSPLATTTTVRPAPKNILHLDSSLNPAGNSRANSAAIVEGLKKKNPEAKVVTRDLTQQSHLPAALVSEGLWFNPAAERTDEHQKMFKLSDEIVAEAQNADVIVIGAPVYNFGPDQGLKSWIDHVARMGKTFTYGADGPAGLLPAEKSVIVAISAGGTKLGSEVDHVSPWLKTVLNFVGLKDHTFIWQTPTEEDKKTVAVEIEAALQTYQ